MKKQILSLLALLIAGLCNAQTLVSGGIFSNTTWTLANSPYIITGPVVIFPSATLTIEPGVTIKVREISTVIGAQAYLEVRGKLIAKGTAGNQISFIAETAPTVNFTYTWEGIKVKQAQGAKLELDQIVLADSYYGINYDEANYDTLRFNNSIFRNNNYAFTVNANLEFNGCLFENNGVGVGGQFVYGTVYAKNSLFKNNYACLTFISGGITAENSRFENNEVCFTMSSGKFDKCTFSSNVSVFRESGNLYIDSCTFTTNGMGIEGFGAGSIRNSVFRGNQTALIAGAEAIIENNEIENNDIGLGLRGNFTTGLVLPFIKDNRICNNFQYNLENKSDFNIGVESNCFCLPDSSSIDAKIYDGYDDITRGLINFAVYDSSCLTLVQRYIKINLVSTGLESNRAESFVIYPNPFSQELNIRLTNENSAFLDLYNVEGKLIQQIEVASKQESIDLSYLDAGMYFLTNPQNGFRQKLVKF